MSDYCVYILNVSTETVLVRLFCSRSYSSRSMSVKTKSRVRVLSSPISDLGTVKFRPSWTNDLSIFAENTCFELARITQFEALLTLWTPKNTWMS